ncbi:MAG: PP2C family protein-serine/threonine phosphatase [bacterium]
MARVFSLRENFTLLLIALAGAGVFFGLFSRIAPAARLDLDVNRREALQLARAYVQSLGFHIEDFAHNASLIVDNRQESFLQALGVEAQKRAQFEKHQPSASWQVIFRHPEQNERFELRLSPSGEVYHFEHIVPAQAVGPPFPPEKAKALVESFLQERHRLALAEYDLIDLQFLKREARTDYIFRWEKRNAGNNEVKWRLWASAYVPMLFPLGSGIYHSLYFISYAALFTLALLKRHLKHVALAVAITLLTFDLLFADAVMIYPRWLQAGVGMLGGMIIYAFYLRYELMTVASGIVFYYALPLSWTYVLQPDRTYQISGWASLGILGMLAIFGYVVAVRGRIIEEQEVAPRYVRNITERERMKMELDIARKAQLRMLPQEIPRFSGLDIAALCEPAKEVGGDYYDFVFFDNQRLGIVIGDVSGKGMPAALYMTLTKGFLQAQAHPAATPHEILSRMNRNFFRAAERSIFVSLFYAVIDPAGRTMTYARAGHNPTIVRRTRQQRTQKLQPTGLALGLESGEIFERILQQESATLESGDALIFYTDGLTEGMNHGKEEFGEQRLLEIISQSEERFAQELLDRIHTEYRAFIGREDQHDDLTCVVVKMV